MYKGNEGANHSCKTLKPPGDGGETAEGNSLKLKNGFFGKDNVALSLKV